MGSKKMMKKYIKRVSMREYRNSRSKERLNTGTYIECIICGEIFTTVSEKHNNCCSDKCRLKLKDIIEKYPELL